MSNSIVRSALLCVLLFALVLPCGITGQEKQRRRVKIVCPPNPHVQLVFQVRPKYPKEAKDAGIKGKVVLHCIVKEDGSVGEIYVIEGKEPFIQVAKAAVARWKYKPVTLNAVAVQTDTVVTIIFESPKRNQR